MNTQTQEALKMAIEAFELEESTWWSHTKMAKAYQACKEALEQPAQEPVAWIEVATHHEKYQTSKVILLDKGIKLPHDTPLYTHPAPACQECENLKHDLEGYMDANKALINREWQGLSDTEYMVLASNFTDDENMVVNEIGFARAIEQALKEKNEK